MSDLIQIEEPEPRDRMADRGGFGIGLELTSGEVRLAASIGGNAELILGNGGRLGWLPTRVGYDDSGNLVAGREGLVDETGFDLIECAARAAWRDPRGADAETLLICLMIEVQRKLATLALPPIGGAVLVAVPAAGASVTALLLRAAEQSGLNVLRIVSQETAEAEAQAWFSRSTPGLAVLGAALLADLMLHG